MAILIKLSGFTLSLLTYAQLEFLAGCLASVFMKIPSSRKRVLCSNLKHSFPHWSNSELKANARISANRMIEMGFFSLCYPFLSRDKLRRTLYCSQETEKSLAVLRASGKAIIFLVPHFCLFETLATSQTFRPGQNKKLGAIYRPNRNSSLDNCIKNARSKTGLVPLSRKDGFFKAKDFLKGGNWLVVLFDQNAGEQGALFDFLGRIASISTLPDILQNSVNALPVYASTKRLSFFRAELKLLEMEPEASISVSAHRELEASILSNPNGLPEWLWSHGKWKVHYYPDERFNLNSKRTLISSADIKNSGTKLLVRMPNWLGDVMMALPLIRAIRHARPDMSITLLCQPKYSSLLKALNLDAIIMELPSGRFLKCAHRWLKLKANFYECHLLLTNSLRGDIEAAFLSSSQRLGLCIGSKWRPLLTHKFNVPRLDFEGRHLSETWEMMAKAFGLKQKVSYKPFRMKLNSQKEKKIGIAIGSSNNPIKQWKSASWLELCDLINEMYTNYSICIYGTNSDRDLSKELIRSSRMNKMKSLAGKTSILELAQEFLTCSIVIGCDSGAVHLANTVGVPSVVIFGPTNPVVTRPVYTSANIICKPDKGNSVNDITPKEVSKKIFHLLDR